MLVEEEQLLVGGEGPLGGGHHLLRLVADGADGDHRLQAQGAGESGLREVCVEE